MNPIIVGNEGIKTYARRVSSEERLLGAYIIEGAPGRGRLLMARYMCACALCKKKRGDVPCLECIDCRRIFDGEHPDVIELAPEEDKKQISVDAVREINAASHIVPAEGDRRFFIIKPADAMTVQAQNALLKTIEEPSQGVTFILAVSDITAVLPTVLSRCFRLKTEAVEIKTMTALLREKYPEKSADELEKIALLSGGSVGSALKLAEDEEFAALRKRAEDFTEKCTRGAGLAELFDTFGDNSDKNGVLTLMAMLKLSFRDVIVSRFSGMTGFTPMFWSDTERLYSLCGIPDEKYLLKLFSKLEELLTPSNKNVNVSIAVTAFILCAAGFDSDIASREYH